jgi:prepilin peptidase CpaA
LLQLPSSPIVVCAVAGSAGSSAIVDIYTRRVPNPLTLGVAALGLVLGASHLTGVGLMGAFGGFAVGLALMLPGHIVGATGAGDVKLFAAIGTLLGPRATVVAFAYTAIAGGILAIVVACQRKRLSATVGRTAALVRSAGANVAEIEQSSQDNRFAYAPAIAVGAFAAALGL